MQEIEAIKKYYADRAVNYDDTAGYTNAQSEKLRKGMKIRYRKFFKGHKVLEIACGTGYWTEVIAKTAGSVLATDINKTMLSIVRKRLANYKNVKFRITDAYKLDRIPGNFSGVFSHWWWSHMPKSKIRRFLTNLHKKLEPGARVLFTDHPGYAYRELKVIHNQSGDRLEERFLNNGKKCYIIKNFPTKKEIYSYLSGIARNIKFKRYRGRWELTYYTLKKEIHYADKKPIKRKKKIT